LRKNCVAKKDDPIAPKRQAAIPGGAIEGYAKGMQGEPV
jgi:hypothetical protein